MDDMLPQQIAVVGAAFLDDVVKNMTKLAGMLILRVYAYISVGRGGLLEAVCRSAAGSGGSAKKVLVNAVSTAGAIRKGGAAGNGAYGGGCR